MIAEASPAAAGLALGGLPLGYNMPQEALKLWQREPAKFMALYTRSPNGCERQRSWKRVVDVSSPVADQTSHLHSERCSGLVKSLLDYRVPMLR
jgi:hypothetical protein